MLKEKKIKTNSAKITRNDSSKSTESRNTINGIRESIKKK